MFGSKSYENWICHNFGFLSDCNVVEVLHDWPQMKQLLGQAGILINRFSRNNSALLFGVYYLLLLSEICRQQGDANASFTLGIRMEL